MDELLREILIAIKQRAREVLNKLDDGDDDDDEDGEGGRKRLIIARWRQILEMVEGEL